MFGDAFNLFIVTDVSIDLYRVLPEKQTAKPVKSVALGKKELGEPTVFYEPMANVVVVVDTRGHCQTYYLSMWEKGMKGKSFQLENIDN